ncbi:SCO2524 family protein [Microbispora sp. NBC_01189]|uniref:SCO2524 family protein n=1 Tax=Microbispora sp. NBC_01189 TaxID=2903583 RepID=UPI002E0E728C|nr:SCO2524 family protein [Microbispora sp. NBC_01189]
MRLQPRQQLLELWEAAARASYRDGAWAWGGRDGSNSISDAEQLLCFMYPASELPGFRLDTPNETGDDVLAALTVLGDSVEIPKLLLKVIGQYLRTYTAEDGRPIFSGGSYFRTQEDDAKVAPEQLQLDVVDSFSMSVTLALGTLGFLKVFRQSVRRQSIRGEIRELEDLAGKRLSAAMAGLLRSFTVNAFDPASPAGRALLRTVNQTGAPTRRVLDDLRRELRPVRAGLRDLTIGSGSQVDLDNENLLFECGWTWGIVKNAPAVVTPLDIGPQPEGVAADTPFLYFTVNALVGISDLFSPRTRVLSLLNDDQITLAEAIQRRWDLTQLYWRTIATYGRGTWPLEDIPWRTVDEKESDYYSLGVTAMVVQSLVNNRSADVDLDRVGAVLEELAIRARIIRRAVPGDPPVLMHSPGVPVNLHGSDALGPHLLWMVSDFAITLLKRTIWAASIAQNTRMRERLLTLADQIWRHILLRRHTGGPAAGLWDQPGNVFTGIEARDEEPSWYFSERVAEFLVAAATASGEPPLRSPQLVELAYQMLGEAEHLLDQEMVTRPLVAGQTIQPKLRTIQSALQRARTIISDRPATAQALINDALLDLERLAAARDSASEAI